jgi:O-antigen ligase
MRSDKQWIRDQNQAGAVLRPPDRISIVGLTRRAFSKQVESVASGQFPGNGGLRSRNQTSSPIAIRERSSKEKYGERAAPVARNPHSVGSKIPGEAHWNLAFFGVMFYGFIEYSRLPEMYTVFQMFYLGKVAIILAMVGYLINPKIRANGRSPSKGIDVAIVVFVLGNLLSACLASPQTHVWDTFFQALYYAIVYFLLTRILTSAWQIRTFLFMVLLLNLKLAQHTVRSYFTDRSAGMSDMRIIMTGGAGAGSASFFGNAGDLGLAMTVVWGIVWAWLVGKVEQKRVVRAFLAICFVFFFLGILFCGARGAVVGATMIALVALVRSPKRVRAAFLTLVFALGLWLVLPGASKQRFSAAWDDWRTDPDSASRITYWELGLDLFEQNPLLGVGPGNFMNLNPFHQVEHSVYIQVLAESGLVGTVSFLAMLVIFFRQNARTRKVALQPGGPGRRSFEYCLALGLDLGMVGFLGSGTFLSVLYYPHLWILLGLSVALSNCAKAAAVEPAVEKFTQNQRNFATVTS